MDDPIALARPTLARVVEVLADHQVRTSPLPDAFVGAGVLVPSTGSAYSVISVAAGGNEFIANLTIGVLKDVRHDRLTVLDHCNRLTRDNAAYPYFLHDAEAGWDILVQVRLPVGVVVDSPSYLVTLVCALPAAVATVVPDLRLAVGGSPYRAGASDAQRLLLRSLL